MDKCLVTTLKGTVNNGNLPAIGEFKLTAAQNATFSASIVERGSVKIRLVGDGYLSSTEGGNEGKEITFTAGGTVLVYTLWIYVTSGTCDIFVKDDYTNTLSVNGVTNMMVDVSLLKYRNHMNQFYAVRLAYGSLEGDGLLDEMTWDFNINTSPDAKVNTNVFRGNSVLRSVRLFATKSYGDLLDFSSAINLTRLWLDSCEVVGRLEDLLEAWAGNKSSDCSIGLSKSKVTFHESLIVSSGWTASFSGNTITVKDANNNTLGTYDGTNWDYPQQ